MWSFHILRILRSVDDLWNALEALGEAPLWIHSCLEKNIVSIDLDLAEGAAPANNPGAVVHFHPKMDLHNCGEVRFFGA